VTPRRVLVLCTGNSARSQLAEAIFRAEGGKHLEVASAGSDPKGAIHPLAIEVARDLLGLDLARQRPKPVSDFQDQRFDVVVTVCDHAAERCPVFPGAPERLHWSLPDPATRQDFEAVALALRERIRAYLASVTGA
jgi:protein-tyrosine-phosphatase